MDRRNLQWRIKGSRIIQGAAIAGEVKLVGGPDQLFTQLLCQNDMSIVVEVRETP